MEGVSLPWQGWDSLSQSGLPCHSCCTYGNPPYVDKRSSVGVLHMCITELGPAEEKSS